MSRRPCHELVVCNGRPGLSCTCRQDAHHDTDKLPSGGFYFAPGTVEHAPARKRLTGWRRLVVDIAVVLAVSGCLGFAAGYLQVKGWPL